MSELDPRITDILGCLNEIKTRATYAAVAAIVGGSPRSVGGRLGARRPEASWVVEKRTGRPGGYEPHELHADLFGKSYVIDDGDELRRKVAIWKAARKSSSQTPSSN